MHSVTSRKGARLVLSIRIFPDHRPLLASSFKTEYEDERASPYRSGPDPSRRSASQPEHPDRPRTRWPSHARPQKTWPFDVRDVWHFPQPYLEAPKGLRGRAAQTTRVGVKPNIERHLQKSQRSRRRTGARENRHPVFHGQIKVPQN